MGGGDCGGGVLWRLELSVAATGSGTDEKLCLRVGLTLLLGLLFDWAGFGLGAGPGGLDGWLFRMVREKVPLVGLCERKILF